MNINKLTAAFILSLIAIWANCQSTPKRLLGSFVYANKSYNYEFAKESDNVFTLLISSANTKSKSKDSTIQTKASTLSLDSNSHKKDSTNKDGTKNLLKADTATSQTDTTIAADNEIDDNDDATDDNDDAIDEKDTPTTFSEFSKEVFEQIFLEQMRTKYGMDTSTEEKKDEAKEKALEVFYLIKARLDFLDDEPITAYIILKKDNINSFLKANSSVYYDAYLSHIIVNFRLTNVEIETEDGAIKNLTVRVTDKKIAPSPRKPIIFKNQYPISISGKFDAEKFADVNLYCINCSGVEGLSRYIKLSDLLTLDIVLENDKEDYSPSNQTVTVSPAKPIIELRKEKRSRILEVAAFTDFTGLDQEQPNGLIQIEARRKININTKYYLLTSKKRNLDIASQINLSKNKVSKEPIQADDRIMKENGKAYTDKNYWFYEVTPKTKKPYKNTIKNDSTNKQKTGLTALQKNASGQSSEPVKNTDSMYFKKDTIPVSKRPFRSSYYNIFGYIEPRLLFAKLEENNRIIDSTLVVDHKINPLLAYQYQLASFGVSANVLKFSFPQVKLNWNVFTAGLYWFRTRIYDSSITNKETTASIPLNGKYWQFTTNVVFRPDNRWGAGLSLDYIKHNIMNQTYGLTNKHGLWQVGFDAYLKTNNNPDSKLFFRFRWIQEAHNRKNNFTQIQMGYSINLFANKAESKN